MDDSRYVDARKRVPEGLRKYLEARPLPNIVHFVRTNHDLFPLTSDARGDTRRAAIQRRHEERHGRVRRG